MKITIKESIRLILVFVFILSFNGTIYAQFDEDDLETDNATPCFPESLVSIYDQYKQSEPDLNQVKQWYSFGSEYFKQEDYKSAIPYLWKVFVNDTTKMGMYAIRKVADGYFNLKYADSTLIACYRGLAQFPDLTTLHYYAGLLQLNMGRNNCALPHYEFLVEHNPEVETYLDKLAQLYFKKKDERAIEIQRKLKELAPDNPAYSTRLAYYLEYFGYDPLAELRDAFQKDPMNKNNAYRLGKAELEVGNYQEAIMTFSKIIEQGAENDTYYKLRAQAYEGLRKYISAIADHKIVLKNKPNDTDIMCSIATDYKLLNKFADGQYWIKKATRVKPNSGLPHIVMAEIYEASIPFCQAQANRGRKIDDGLVYNRAIEEYRLAQSDPAYTSYAKRRIELLEPLKPTQEELFFANGDTTLKYECYTGWIEEEFR